MNNIYILAITVFFLSAFSNVSQAEEIENRFNIYISKLSNEEIEDNLSRGLKPIAIKDNIDVKGFANTAGSLALKDNLPSNNAFLIQQLVDKGYFVIGKTNLSEWANFRSSSSTSGWSSTVSYTHLTLPTSVIV